MCTLPIDANFQGQAGWQTWKVYVGVSLNSVEFRYISRQNQVVQQLSYMYNVKPELLRSKVKAFEPILRTSLSASSTGMLLVVTKTRNDLK